MSIDAGMLAEMSESIEHLYNPLKIEINTMEKTKIINAGMLAEILESIENL